MRINTLILAIFHVVYAFVEDVFLTLCEQFLAFGLALIKVVLVDFVAEIAQHKIADHCDACEPYYESNEMKHISINNEQ